MMSNNVKAHFVDSGYISPTPIECRSPCPINKNPRTAEQWNCGLNFIMQNSTFSVKQKPIIIHINSIGDRHK